MTHSVRALDIGKNPLVQEIGRFLNDTEPHEQNHRGHQAAEDCRCGGRSLSSLPAGKTDGAIRDHSPLAEPDLRQGNPRRARP